MNRSRPETSRAARCAAVTRRAGNAALATALLGFASCVGPGGGASDRSERFKNAYPAPDDTGRRASLGYIARRAWLQITSRAVEPDEPRVLALDLDEMSRMPLAVAWLGHSTLLVRAGAQWILTDPTLYGHVGPAPGFGPRRLIAFPMTREALPRIDVVLISHDHYDHLDLRTLRWLARQAGGPPHFLAGAGLGAWFAAKGLPPAQEFHWWQTTRIGDAGFTFVPAQHSSGRSLWSRNSTLWGGWVIERAERRVYFAGDTAYVPQLFADLRERFGRFDLAALPIGAFQPRDLMRHEHTDPEEAMQAHSELGARRSIALHWGTFQLGDETAAVTVAELKRAAAARGIRNFTTVEPGRVIDVTVSAAPGTVRGDRHDSGQPSFCDGRGYRRERHVPGWRQERDAHRHHGVSGADCQHAGPLERVRSEGSLQAERPQ
jgi:N-acyl-phosphatidylethanolamine-hydrolysing phospholipase D